VVRGVWRDLYGPEPMPMPPYSRDWGETGVRESLAEAARKVMPEIPVMDLPLGALILFRMRTGAVAKHGSRGSTSMTGRHRRGERHDAVPFILAARGTQRRIRYGTAALTANLTAASRKRGTAPLPAQTSDARFQPGAYQAASGFTRDRFASPCPALSGCDLAKGNRRALS
jgi:NlpC/P60 family putative phage cell wall peptidase